MAGTYLVLRDDQREFDDKQIVALSHVGVQNASRADLAVFFHQARKTGLDPFSRQIYMIGRWDGKTQSTKWTIQAAIDGLRIVALRTGEYVGQEGPSFCGPDGEWQEVWLGDGPPRAAKVGVLRRGFDKPVYAVAKYDSYVQTSTDKKTGETKPTSTWAKMPDVMLAKCAEALALRKAFPHDLAGIYSEEEMGQADSPREDDAAARLRAAAKPEAKPDVIDVEVTEETSEETTEEAPDEAPVEDPPAELWEEPQETTETAGPAAARAAIKKPR
jgi:phage recombination protein Bet